MKELIGEWIALIVTAILALVLLGFGTVMALQVLHGTAVDTTLSRSFDMLLLAFVAVWRTNFPASNGTTVNASPTDTLTVNAQTEK